MVLQRWKFRIRQVCWTPSYTVYIHRFPYVHKVSCAMLWISIILESGANKPVNRRRGSNVNSKIVLATLRIWTGRRICHFSSIVHIIMSMQLELLYNLLRFSINSCCSWLISPKLIWHIKDSILISQVWISQFTLYYAAVMWSLLVIYTCK